jgi:site-specific DNA-methyltransferase (adenine-specific)
MDVSKAIEAKVTTGGSSPKNLRQQAMGVDYRPHVLTGSDGFSEGRGGGYGADVDRDRTQDRPINTDAAKQWAGWGTALKPAHEVWWLARKPLEGTVAGNVLAHGTGALNIDGCRVGTEVIPATRRGVSRLGTFEGADGNVTPEHAGRWPPNLLLSHSEDCVEGGDCAGDCAVAEMDRQSGVLKSGARAAGSYENHGFMGARKAPLPALSGDCGGASRFFPVFRYEPKAAAADKESGLEYSGKAARGNTHPTPKPVALMEWLIRLITPPSGTVLDPFMGSGTTGVAATKLGHGFVGCEREREYFGIAQARIGATPLPTR